MWIGSLAFKVETKTKTTCKAFSHDAVFLIITFNQTKFVMKSTKIGHSVKKKCTQREKIPAKYYFLPCLPAHYAPKPRGHIWRR